MTIGRTERSTPILALGGADSLKGKVSALSFFCEIKNFAPSNLIHDMRIPHTNDT